MSLLALDSRWRRFHDAGRTCPCCGQRFSGVFDIGYDHPDMWPHDGLRDTGQDVIEVGGDKLGSDLCRIGEDHFIRVILPLPIAGSDERFCFGVWGSVHKDSFDAYVRASVENDPKLFDGCFSWLCNDLPLFGTADTVPCDMMPAEDPRHRPTLKAQVGPIAEAQTTGISFDMLLDIYDAAGMDVRRHLAAD